MKEVFAMLLLLMAVEGESFWSNYHSDKWTRQFQPPGHAHLPPGQSFLPPGQSFQPPGHSFQPPGPPFPLPGLGLGRNQNWNFYAEQQHAIDVGNTEWICQNPRTRDMMIIAAVDGAQTIINTQPRPHGRWPNPNSNENSQDQKPNNGNFNMNSGTTTPLPNKPTRNTNTDESALNTGEGLIDIRIGAN